jgi:DNA-binding NarL/FixJ family response regulator
MKKKTTTKTKAPKTSKPASKAKALSAEKLEKIKAVATAGVTNPDMLETAVDAIIDAPETAKNGKREAPTSKARAKKTAKPAKAKDAAAPREGSKKQTVLLLLARKDGATMAEIADATGWQKHSIRGFISGNVTKKMGLAVESSKNEAGERVYRTK